ncbi:Putative fluoride ion transporter CrcB [Corynebacterium capitovis DSM 44611]|uniref:FluC/FEX family fluoride channel n=1 Tax=Corynebacterium capitovis TaxID=131081 RepID=UPI00037818D4|nr:CrcB family protein [Corynebacterium capitovis]WKD57096.1 Putative fluoride ion transporter CrcB [Corynebacterium capitovis DSM 44611]
MNAVVVSAAVFAGGFAGGVTRWALSLFNRGALHTGTLAANVVGSMVLGAAASLPGILPVLVGTGFAGALSTLSTLARELGHLIRDGHWARAAAYATLTAVLGAAGAYLGTRLV